MYNLINQSPSQDPNFKMLSYFGKTSFFGIKHLHVKVQYLPIVYTKYDNVPGPVKPMEGVEFLMQAQSKHHAELHREVKRIGP